jgi:hypothetical protein
MVKLIFTKSAKIKRRNVPRREILAYRGRKKKYNFPCMEVIGRFGSGQW